MDNLDMTQIAHKLKSVMMSQESLSVELNLSPKPSQKSKFSNNLKS